MTNVYATGNPQGIRGTFEYYVTSGPPAPAGRGVILFRPSPRQAAGFGAALAGVGLVVLAVRVNVLTAPPKRSRRARSRRLLVRHAGYKKAVVTLAEGQTIDLFEGVK